jgi:glycosyltransferase involved in cell wall biosynthesis
MESLKLSVTIGSGQGTRWTQLGLPAAVRAGGADVLFAPAYEAPLLSRVPTVLSVHDVSFFAHPRWFAPRERLRRQLSTIVSAHRASRILTFSEFSKREIVRHLRVRPEIVEVTYHGVTRLPPTPLRGLRRTSPNDPNDPNDLVLFVGSIFNRRHVPELIEGFSRLASRHPAARLEIVGDNRTRPHQDLIALAGRHPHARVHARSYVSDDELAALYARARAFAFLSDYEGFGMTPLEALAAGVPIAVLDTPVAREIYGPAALYLASPEPSLIEEALARLLHDEAERTRILAAAADVLGRYSWQACGRQTLQALLGAHR